MTSKISAYEEGMKWVNLAIISLLSLYANGLLVIPKSYENVDKAIP